MQLFAAQRFNSLVQVQLLIRLLPGVFRHPHHHGLQLRNVSDRHEFLALVDEHGRLFLAAQQFNYIA